jgi:hypothetical protein
MHYNSGGSYWTWSNIIPKRGKSVKLKQKCFDFTKIYSSIKILHLSVHNKLKTIAFLQAKEFARSDKTFSSTFSHFYGKCIKQISPVKKKRKKIAILQRRDQPIYRF